MDKLRQAIAALAIALLALPASANEVDLRLERVPLYQLCRVVFGEILSEPYVLDGAIIASEDVATIDMRRTTPASARMVLESLLAERGFQVTQQKGVTFVKRASTSSKHERILIYRPKHRSVAYLQGAIRSFLPHGRFAGASPGASEQIARAPGTGRLAPNTATQSAVESVIPAQGAVLASQDVLVYEAEEPDVAKANKLIEELDRPARSVVVRAYVLEVGASQSDASAVSLMVNLLGGKLSAGGSPAHLGYSARISVPGIDAAVSMLQNDSRFRVLSAPTLRIRSGERAKLSVGSEVPVLGSISMTSTGQPAQSVEYRSSGVILDVRADVLQEVIHLEVQQQVSSFVATTTGVNASPTLLKRELSTSLVVAAGELVALGGLDDVRSSEAKSGPGGFFAFLGSRAKEAGRSELVLLLEASVAPE